MNSGVKDWEGSREPRRVERQLAAPEQTHLVETERCVQCERSRLDPLFPILHAFEVKRFGEAWRSSERKLLLPSHTPHLAYSAGLLLDFSRCQRINVTGSMFGSVTCSVKWSILDWAEMEATSNLFSHSTQLTVWEGRHERQRSERSGGYHLQQTSAKNLWRFFLCEPWGDSKMNCPAKRHIEEDNPAFVQFQQPESFAFFLLNGIAFGRDRGPRAFKIDARCHW